MTFGTAGMVGTAVVCSLGVASIVGTTGTGRPSECRLWHRDIESGGSLHCGCWGIWNSVSRFDTVFM